MKRESTICKEMGEAFIKGWNSYALDSDNPYQKGSDEEREWNVGHVLRGMSPADEGEKQDEPFSKEHLEGFRYAACGLKNNPYEAPASCADYAPEVWHEMYTKYYDFMKGNAWYVYSSKCCTAREYSGYYY